MVSTKKQEIDFTTTRPKRKKKKRNEKTYKGDLVLALALGFCRRVHYFLILGVDEADKDLVRRDLRRFGSD